VEERVTLRRVFISHIHEEKDVALALDRLIEAQLGGAPGSKVEVFLSSDRFRWHAGEDWLKRIKAELSQADVVVVLLSPQSLARPWVNLEAGAAWVLDRTIIPALHSGLSLGELPRPYSDFDVAELEKDPYHLLRSLGQGMFYPPALRSEHPAHQTLQEAIQRNRERLGRQAREE
jgi:hypothetical protein